VGILTNILFLLTKKKQAFSKHAEVRKILAAQVSVLNIAKKGRKNVTIFVVI
jgi:hypothetical protein